MSVVNRIELLQILEAVQPGLSASDIVEQSASFVFKDGRVYTYNDEVACRIKSPFAADFIGSVPATQMLNALRRLPDDELEIERRDDGLFWMTGKRDDVWLRMETEIIMPLDAVDAPNEWADLNPDFGHAVGLVQDCVSRAKDKFKLQCVHVMPKYVEASDNLQMARYKIKSGILEESLFKQSSLRHIVQLDATRVSEAASWVHFKNPAGLTLSVRKHIEQYPQYDGIMEHHGEPIVLPRWLVEATEIAGEFVAETENGVVTVQLRPGKMRLIGEGLTGGASRRSKVEYDGPEMAFRIAPKLLAGIIQKRSPDAELIAADPKNSLGRLRINGDKWVYFTCLGKPPADKRSKKDNGEETDRQENDRKPRPSD